MQVAEIRREACLLLALFDSPVLLRWYPVLMSSFMLALFGLTNLFGLTAEGLVAGTQEMAPA